MFWLGFVFSSFFLWIVQSRRAGHYPKGLILNDGNIMPIAFGTFGPVVDIAGYYAGYRLSLYLERYGRCHKRSGLMRSIGVSNFNSSHINDIIVNSQIRPAVNQIEINPTYTNLEVDAYCRSQGIRVMSYSPFGYLVPRPGVDVPQSVPGFDHPILTKIAKKYHKRTSEVVIRYLTDRGATPIPKSTNKEHIISNINVFDFSLTKEEIYLINQINLNTPVYSNRNVTVFFYQYFFGTSIENYLATYLP